MRKLLFLFFIIFLFSACNGKLDENTYNNGMLKIISLDNCPQFSEITNLELYPFVPFTDKEMRELPYKVKLERRQIPEDFLKKMTTKALFYQFVFCELSRTMYAFNTAQAGFEVVVKQLNMIPELLKRPDAGHVLLEIMQKINPSEIVGLDCFHCYYAMNMIAAQTEIINNMTDQDINNYISIQIEQLQTIRELSEKNENWSYPESAGVILFGLGNVMIRYDFEPFMQLLKTNQNINGLMASAMIKNEPDALLIINCINEFKNKMK